MSYLKKAQEGSKICIILRTCAKSIKKCASTRQLAHMRKSYRKRKKCAEDLELRTTLRSGDTAAALLQQQQHWRSRPFKLWHQLLLPSTPPQKRRRNLQMGVGLGLGKEEEGRDEGQRCQIAPVAPFGRRNQSNRQIREVTCQCPRKSCPWRETCNRKGSHLVTLCVGKRGKGRSGGWCGELEQKGTPSTITKHPLRWSVCCAVCCVLCSVLPNEPKGERIEEAGARPHVYRVCLKDFFLNTFF